MSNPKQPTKAEGDEVVQSASQEKREMISRRAQFTKPLIVSFVQHSLYTCYV